MSQSPLARQRTRAGLTVAAVVTAGTLWFFSPGIPVLWGPSASAAQKEAGRDLFEHEWAANDPLAHGDGLGPVFNAKSCVACHFQGGVGGGGDVMHNATGFEILPRPNDPTFRTGTVHNFSTAPADRETAAQLNTLFPVVRGRPTITMAGCAPITPPDFSPVRLQPVSATALFGAGWVDRISEKAITHNWMKRSVDGMKKEFQLDFSNGPQGRVRKLADGRVGKFGWKAQFASLEEFVAAACANELGLGTPTTAQAAPLHGRAKPPADAAPDLDREQFRALVAFVDTLPRPVELAPTAPVDASAAEHGKKLFGTVGCAVCHVPDLGGVKGVYSDFLLHILDDPTPNGGANGYGPEVPDFPRPEDDARPDEWKTPALWGVADSAPYFHDGAAPTLADAIRRHQGEAKGITEKYTQLSKADQATVIAFLRTLKAPPDAAPLKDLSVTRLARN